MLIKFVLLLSAFCMSVASKTTVSGDITGRVFDATGNPYLVTADILVHERGVVNFKEGCVFLFAPFTALIVNGSLKVEGAADNPVVFTSEQNTRYNKAARKQPEPFDWNGIDIKAGIGEVYLENSIVSYSVFGVKSQKDDIRIENGLFYQNGQYHCTINGALQPVEENTSWSYNMEKTHKYAIGKKGPGLLKTAAFSTAFTGVLCMAAAVPSLRRAIDANHDGNAQYIQHEIDLAYNRERRELKKTAMIAGPGALLLCTSAVLFVLNGRRNTESAGVGVYPIVVDNSTGLALVVWY